MLFRAECWAPGRTRKKNYRASPEPSLLVATALPPRRHQDTAKDTVGKEYEDLAANWLNK